MDCGAGGTTCDLISAALDLVRAISPWVEARWKEFAPSDPRYHWEWLLLTFGFVLSLIKPHLEAIIGLAGFSFAIYRWHRHRERVLHKRLDEYLVQEEQRLATARNHLIDRIERPITLPNAQIPGLAVGPLKRLLKRSGWHRRHALDSVLSAAHSDAAEALNRVEHQLGVLEKTQKNFFAQQMSALMIQGTILAAQAPQILSRTERRARNEQALDKFKRATAVPGYTEDYRALMSQGEQLRILERYQLALQTYQAAVAAADNAPDGRTRGLRKSRALRHTAEILHRQGAPGLANNAINSAKAIRQEIGNSSKWEKLEEAELFLISAAIKHSLNFVILEDQDLASAATCYDALRRNRLALPFLSRETQQLHQMAVDGCKRVGIAREERRYAFWWK